MSAAELERKIAELSRQRETLTRAISRLERLAKWAGEHRLKPLATWLRGREERVRQRRGEVTERIGELKRDLRRVGSIPEWLPSQYAALWEKPWTVDPDPASAGDFKSRLWQHGLVSPNFTRREAGGEDRHPQGCAVPESLRGNVQRHAFMLERARHELGDRGMTPGSWYRCPNHNSAVGGASASQHMNAHATDWFSDERARLGGDGFDATMERVFSAGGRGYQGVVGGPIRHVDNGPARTWVYA